MKKKREKERKKEKMERKRGRKNLLLLIPNRTVFSCHFKSFKSNRKSKNKSRIRKESENREKVET